MSGERDTPSISTPASDRGGDPVLRVEDLAKTYGDGEDAVTAVDGVSFAVSEGEVVGLLGPNGAGKTTTIKSILGVVRPTGGSVTIDGVDPLADGKAVYTRVSAVLEGARNVYWRLTVRENVRYFAGIQGRNPGDLGDEVDDLLELVGLTGKADETVRHLSRGMQQKVALACALVRRTPVLFLDEPTLGLDVEASRDLRREIRRLADEEGRTIVVSSHDMDVIQSVCDRVIIVDDGRVVADESVSDLLALFDTQTYAVELAERPDGSPLAEFGVDWADDRPAFEVVLGGSDELYDLMDRLREIGAEIRDVDSVEPDLEEVFVRVVEEGAVAADVEALDTVSQGSEETEPFPAMTPETDGGREREGSSQTGERREGGDRR